MKWNTADGYGQAGDFQRPESNLLDLQLHPEKLIVLFSSCFLSEKVINPFYESRTVNANMHCEILLSVRRTLSLSLFFLVVPSSCSDPSINYATLRTASTLICPIKSLAILSFILPPKPRDIWKCFPVMHNLQFFSKWKGIYRVIPTRNVTKQ